ncbi:hypothetical protein [Candidatus Hodarchaeum mangrovi]
MYAQIPVYKNYGKILEFSENLKKEDIEFFAVNITPDQLIDISKDLDILFTSQTYVMVNNSSKHIFLWIGKEAPVRLRFLGAYLAHKLQQRKGFTYRVISIDQENESDEFIKSLAILYD